MSTQPGKKPLRCQKALTHAATCIEKSSTEFTWSPFSGGFGLQITIFKAPYWVCLHLRTSGNGSSRAVREKSIASPQLKSANPMLKRYGRNRGESAGHKRDIFSSYNLVSHSRLSEEGGGRRRFPPT
jgi:hypothetical protein